MKKTTLGLLSLVAAAAYAAPAQAQLPNLTPFSLEVRGGAALPIGDFGESDGEEGVDTGYTLGANATFQFMPTLGIYAGYTYNRFSIEGIEELDVVDKGFNAGVRLAVPTPLIPIDPYLKAGVVYNTFGFEADEDDAELSVESDNSFGFEVGAGIGIGLGPKLSFTPQVTYTRYEPQVDDEGVDFNVEHLRLDVGLRIRL